MNKKLQEFRDIFSELDSILENITDEELKIRLQHVIDTLKSHSVTVHIENSELTIISFPTEPFERMSGEAVAESQAAYEQTTNMNIRTDEKGVRYIETKEVADYYGVTTETVRNWIKDKKISGKQFTKRGKWFIPIEEFEFLKKQNEKDRVEKEINNFLGTDFGADWDVEVDE